MRTPLALQLLVSRKHCAIAGCLHVAAIQLLVPDSRFRPDGWMQTSIGFLVSPIFFSMFQSIFAKMHNFTSQHLRKQCVLRFDSQTMQSSKSSEWFEFGFVCGEASRSARLTKHELVWRDLRMVPPLRVSGLEKIGSHRRNLLSRAQLYGRYDPGECILIFIH